MIDTACGQSDVGGEPGSREPMVGHLPSVQVFDRFSWQAVRTRDGNPKANWTGQGGGNRCTGRSRLTR